ASTGYRAQGQTIEHALIDIATSPTGGLNLFNFSHSPELIRESDRLRLLDEQTSGWWRWLTRPFHELR
ncbi:hypothetical protein M405DRAFT_730155, partial [Rhizopogon salebrosus TDB-379]